MRTKKAYKDSQSLKIGNKGSHSLECASRQRYLYVTFAGGNLANFSFGRPAEDKIILNLFDEDHVSSLTKK